ncbi:MAG: PBECR4 domain-containing protein, partial [Oscillospiraceae bacterium]
MWLVDLTFLQESANIFEEYFVKKNYKIYTCSGKVFLVINEIKNYPHLIGIRRQILSRLRGSEFLFKCIKNN